MKIPFLGLLLALLCLSTCMFAQVLKPDTNEKSGKLGLVNEKGKFVVKAEYDDISMFADGIYVVSNGTFKGLVNANDPKGKFIRPVTLGHLGAPDVNGLCIYNVDGKFNTKTNRLEGGKWGFMNLKGQTVGKEYTLVQVFGLSGENLAAICEGGKSTFDPSWKQPRFIGKGKWGYMDPTGKEIVPCKYADVGSKFSEGIALITDGKKYGFVDKTGKVLTKMNYDAVGEFSEGLVAVKVGDKCGYVDRQGKMAVKPTLRSAGNFTNGLALVSSDIPDPKIKKKTTVKIGYMDTGGNMVVPFKYVAGDATFFEGISRVTMGKDMMGIINMKGEELTPMTYTVIDQPKDGIMWVNRGAIMINEFYITDPNNAKKKIPAEGVNDLPAHLHPSSPNLAKTLAILRDGSPKALYTWSDVTTVPVPALDKKNRIVNTTTQGYVVGGRYGFIDNTGREIVPCEYFYLDKYSENLALAVGPNGCCWFDKSGKMVLSTKFVKAGPFAQDRAFVFDGTAYGVIDSKGTQIVPCMYQSVGGDFQDGVMPVKNGDKWGCIDTNGTVVIPMVCDKIDDIGEVVKAFYIPRGRKPLSDRQVKLYMFTKPGTHNTFSIRDIIPDEMWNY